MKNAQSYVQAAEGGKGSQELEGVGPACPGGMLAHSHLGFPGKRMRLGLIPGQVPTSDCRARTKTQIPQMKCVYVSIGLFLFKEASGKGMIWGHILQCQC